MIGWIEIFRSGTHTDSKGRTRTWTAADLDKMISSYDPETVEAPVVVGHPKSNDPAYGWVEKLKRGGELLLAKFKQVEPKFAQMVSDGRFKKRSISVYPDGRLRHVGFLGATPPALAGLKDIAFADGEAFIEYEQPINTEDPMDPKELQRQLDAERQKRKAAEAKVTEFQQKADTATAKEKQTAADFAASQKQARQKEITDFIESGVKAGTLLPSWKDQGLGEFMSALEDTGGEYEFAEGKKQAPAAWFREFLSGFAAHPLFKEMARPAEDKTGDDADFEADMKTADEMAALVNPVAE